MAAAAPRDHRTAMVGRGRELDFLRGRLDLAMSDQPQAVVLGGDAGVGKSRLVGEFARKVAPTARTIVGHCLELGPDGPPFAPFVMLVRALVHELGIEQATRLAGAGRSDLAVLVPELGPQGADEVHGRGLLFDAVATLLERVAEQRPLVVVVEDMHWSDASTRDLVRFLIRSMRESPVLTVLTYRRDELHRSHPLLSWLAEVERIPRTSRLTLEPLGDDDVDVMVAELAGPVPAPLVTRIRQRSQGIPFFVEELAECVGADDILPESLRGLMLVRLDRLPAAARQVVRVASAAGMRIDEDVLREVADLPAPELEAALREAVEGQVLVIDRIREGYGFRHALMREAVHDDLLPGEHARLHARFAAALQGRGRPEQAGEIAHHWDRAREPVQTFTWSLRAAEHSHAIYAWREELNHLERALELWDRIEPSARKADHAGLLMRASRAAFLLGLADRSLALVDAALREADPDASPQQVAGLLLQRARQSWADPARDALADIDAALRLAGVGSRDRAEALVLRAALLMVEGDLEGALSSAREALAVDAVTTDDEILADAHNIVGCVLLGLGQDQGLHHLEQARDIAARADAWPAMLRYYGNYSDVLIASGRFSEAVDLARAGRAEAAQRGRARTFGVFLAGNEAEAQVRCGDWDDALVTISEGLRLGPMDQTGSHLLALRAFVLAHRGESDAARAAVDRASQRLGGAARQPQQFLPIASVRSQILAAGGDPGGALGILHAAAQAAGSSLPAASGWPFAWTWGRVLAEWADAREQDPATKSALARSAGMLEVVVDRLSQVGHHAGWQAVLAALLAEARPHPAPGAAPAADWAAAVLALAAGEGLRLELAHARICWADQLLDSGDRPAARRELLAAAEQVERMRANSLRPLAARVAARGRIALHRAPRGRSLLTPREQEVVELVAAGRSNRAIADALFISAKTVSVHVSNILAKVGASSRTEVAAWALARSPDEPAPGGVP